MFFPSIFAQIVLQFLPGVRKPTSFQMDGWMFGEIQAFPISTELVHHPIDSQPL